MSLVNVVFCQVDICVWGWSPFGGVLPIMVCLSLHNEGAVAN